MSESPEVNKSKAIRDYMSEHPEARPMHVAEALAARGVQVTPAFVSAVNSTARAKAGLRKKRRGKGRSKGRSRVSVAAFAANASANARKPGRPAGAGRALSLDQLIAAKRFADQMGGVARARAALEALEKVTS